MSQYEILLSDPDGHEHRFPVGAEGILIGRSNDADVPIEGKTVSRRHARVWEDAGVLAVEDLGSRNGVKIDGERVTNANLKEGDRFAVGEHLFTVVRKGQPAPEPASEPSSPSESAPEAEETKPAPKSAVIPRDETRALPSQVVRRGQPPHITALMDAAECCSLVYDEEKLYRRILAAMTTAVSARRGFLLVRGEDTPELRVASSFSPKDDLEGPSLDRTIVQHVAREKAPLLRVDEDSEPHAFGGQGVMCVPLMSAGKCVGLAYLDSGNDPAPFIKDDLELLAAMGQTVGSAIENAWKLEARVERERAEAARAAARGLSAPIETIVSQASAAGEEIERALEDKDVRAVEEGWSNVRPALDRLGDVSASLASLSDESEPDHMPVNVTTIIDEVVDALHGRAEKAGIKLESTANSRIIAHADDDGLRRMIHDLLVSAINAREAGGGTLTISAANQVDGCHIVVSGSGAGLSSQKLPKSIRKPLEMDAEQSVDLGLASVSKIVARHGGELRVQSGDGASASFTIVLPQQEPVTRSA